MSYYTSPITGQNTSCLLYILSYLITLSLGTCEINICFKRYAKPEEVDIFCSLSQYNAVNGRLGIRGKVPVRVLGRLTRRGTWNVDRPDLHGMFPGCCTKIMSNSNTQCVRMECTGPK
jgi:hypothetical protein